MHRSCVRTAGRALLAAAVAMPLVGAGAPVAVAYSLFFAPNAPAGPGGAPLAPRRLPHGHREPKKLPVARPIKGPLLIEVAIADQRLTLFDDGVPIAHAPVSTGMAGHPTPMGVFSVIQKQRYHRSNIYSGAPMPFMQRITWSGVALHAGVLPGYPASHGCIRMPPDFAVKLYGMTKVGARVVITPHEVAPVDIEHAQLAALKNGDAVSHAGVIKPVFPAGVEVADASSAAGSSVVDATKAADASTRKGTPATSAAQPPAVRASAPETAAAPQPAAAPPGPEPATGSTPVAPAAALPVTAPLPDDEVFVPPARPARPLRAGPVSIFISRKTGRLYVRKGFDPLLSVPVSIAHPDQPIGTHVFTAAGVKPDGVSLRWMALSIPTEAPKKADRSVRAKGGRADRRGRSERRESGTAARAPSLTAVQALDRINLPPELAEQLSALMSVGASLIISDQGLGSETGLETDFIVLTTPLEKPARTVRRTTPMVWPSRKSYRDAITFW